MRKDKIDELEESPDMSKSEKELHKNMKIMRMYQRFPLTDLQKEKKEFIKEMKIKFGNDKIDKIIS